MCEWFVWEFFWGCLRVLLEIFSVDAQLNHLDEWFSSFRWRRRGKNIGSTNLISAIDWLIFFNTLTSLHLFSCVPFFFSKHFFCLTFPFCCLSVFDKVCSLFSFFFLISLLWMLRRSSLPLRFWLDLLHRWHQLELSWRMKLQSVMRMSTFAAEHFSKPRSEKDRDERERDDVNDKDY